MYTTVYSVQYHNMNCLSCIISLIDMRMSYDTYQQDMARNIWCCHEPDFCLPILLLSKLHTERGAVAAHISDVLDINCIMACSNSRILFHYSRKHAHMLYINQFTDISKWIYIYIKWCNNFTIIGLKLIHISIGAPDTRRWSMTRWWNMFTGK